MSEVKDPAIKLFGKTIPLQDAQIPEAKFDLPSKSDVVDDHMEKFGDEMQKEVIDTSLHAEGEPAKMDSDSAVKDGKEDVQQAPIKVNKQAVDPMSGEEQMQTDADGGEEKAPRKVDKVLPCPRCKSMDTKFCYYNNYNVNQPRHFCKNCQRYWTAGGTMRNVPVGAGRRKNKHAASNYRHVVMPPDGIPTSRVDGPDCGMPAPTRPLQGNGTVLKFGPDGSLCESMATVLTLGDQKAKVELGSRDNGEEASCGSSVTASICVENELPENMVQQEQGNSTGGSNGFIPMNHPLPCYPGPAWAYPWNSGWNSVAAMSPAGRCSSELVYGPGNSNHLPNPVQWSSPPVLAASAFCATSIPFPFVPAPYWGCMPVWAAGTWNVPWAGSNGSQSPSSSTGNSSSSGNGSPTLGKHSRDANSQGEEKTEKSLWVPKTLRIDDPDEAAKSSIWSTLGIKQNKNDPITKGGIFKAFHPKKKGNDEMSDAEQVLKANPAALSRSQAFQEST